MKKSKLILFLHCVFFVQGSICFAQTSFDTSVVLTNAKLILLSLDNNLKTNEDILYFIDNELPFRLLGSNGFDNIIFFEIKIDSIISGYPKLLQKTDTSATYKSNIILNNYNKTTFVFGYNAINNEIYKIKGFENNSFQQLFNYIKKFSTASENDFKKKNFVKKFNIEGFDNLFLYKLSRIDNG